MTDVIVETTQKVCGNSSLFVSIITGMWSSAVNMKQYKCSTCTVQKCTCTCICIADNQIMLGNSALDGPSISIGVLTLYIYMYTHVYVYM